MTDKFAKSHPWRANLLRDVEISIGHLTIKNIISGTETIVPGAPTHMTVTAGPRMFRKKSDAVAFVDSYRRDHGANCVSDIYHG